MLKLGTRTYQPHQSRSGEWVTVVSLVDQERYDEGPIQWDGSLDDVVASFEAIREMIPEEYRHTSRCEIGSVSGYEGSHYARVQVEYERPATKEEIDAVKERDRLTRAEDYAER